ncbi:GH92 family glycosyl hydrolase [Flavobacterium sp. MAHUQ-51]|uniref:GH92 family glycosyl hydrolase n=1 Tax=Flavobacterium sp. GCM10022190 TaxID=3252639 RepID=UPI00361B72CB
MNLFRLLKYSTFLVALLFILSCSIKPKRTNYVDLVNPLIGTAPSTTISSLQHGEDEKENNAQVVPYVTLPFGMTNWTPETKAKETKCIAPYYYTDTKITGFRGSHWLSGSCVQDYGSMTIMPVSGSLKCQSEERASHFFHDTEKTLPYNYKVNLSDYNINVNMTATKRCGLFEFTYENAGEGHIVINPNSDEGEGFIQINPDKNEIVGYNPVHKIYQGWGDKAGFSGYFVVQLGKSSNQFGVYQNEKILKGITQISNQENIGAYISFTVAKGETITAKIGTSFTSIEQARKNLEAETNNISFSEAKENLKKSWETLLSKIQVEGTNQDEKVKFYTALYHSFLQPRTFNDVDGSYVSFDGGKHLMNSGNEDYYTDFSMWDIYRSSLPLFNLLTPKVNSQMMNSLFEMAEQGDWLPIFPCWNSYTSAMIGDHSIVAIADAYIKNNIEISDKQYAYLLKNAFESPQNNEDYVNGKGRRALKSYLKYGYIPLEDEVKESFHKAEQVSRTLEYAFDDFALSQIATKRGDSINAQILKARALNYKNVYSVSDSCVRGRFADGTFTQDFDKYIRKSYITEGTPYQYTWYVPQDINGLLKLMGGENGFNDNLDRFHAAKQYWHGNEPGHQIPFLYNYGGQPWKTQELVTQIMQQEYSNAVGGLSGNDDAGQMSAWYVFAALGFYPVTPSVPQYVISGPHFDKITIRLDKGKKLIINAKGASSGNNYIQNISFNGEEYDKTFLDHFSIIKGGKLDFKMSNVPNKYWGIKRDSKPFSVSNL